MPFLYAKNIPIYRGAREHPLKVLFWNIKNARMQHPLRFYPLVYAQELGASPANLGPRSDGGVFFSTLPGPTMCCAMDQKKHWIPHTRHSPVAFSILRSPDRARKTHRLFSFFRIHDWFTILYCLSAHHLV